MSSVLPFPSDALSADEAAALARFGDRLWAIRNAIAADWSAAVLMAIRRLELGELPLPADELGALGVGFIDLVLQCMRSQDFEGLSQAFYDMNRHLVEADLARAPAGRISLATMYHSAGLALQVVEPLLGSDSVADIVAYSKLVTHLLMLVGLAYSDAREAALEREVAERTAELTKQKALADTIVETLPGVFFVIDKDQRIVRWNPELERISGYDAAYLSQIHPLDLFDPAERPWLTEKMIEAFTVGTASAEAEIVARDGTRHPRWFTSKRIELDQGPTLIGVGIDISERRSAEARVQREKRFAESIIESLPGVFYLFDENGRFLLWNRNFATVTQYPYETIGNMHPLDFFEGDEKHLVAERIGAVFTTGQSMVEADFVSRDGSRRPHFFTGHRIVVDDRICLIGMGIDVTERRAAEEAVAARTRELARSNADLEQFAYVASHDLQEPLRAVKSYTQLLAHRYQQRLDGDALRFIDRAVAAVDRMQRLIDDLLSYSRVGTVTDPLHRTNCEAVLREVLEDLHPTISETNAQVSHDPLPELAADRSQLRQLLQNLVGNAIKFRGDATPQVHVSAARRGPVWRFRVQDNGIGIDPEFAERVFVIFQRLHSRREYPGTGVGLAVCKRIVERHGGRIWIDVKATPGTCVCFELPAKPGDPRFGGMGQPTQGTP